MIVLLDENRVRRIYFDSIPDDLALAKFERIEQEARR
jgi:hypothetical protein